MPGRKLGMFMKHKPENVQLPPVCHHCNVFRLWPSIGGSVHYTLLLIDVINASGRSTGSGSRLGPDCLSAHAYRSGPLIGRDVTRPPCMSFLFSC